MRACIQCCPIGTALCQEKNHRYSGCSKKEVFSSGQLPHGVTRELRTQKVDPAAGDGHVAGCLLQDTCEHGGRIQTPKSSWAWGSPPTAGVLGNMVLLSLPSTGTWEGLAVCTSVMPPPDESNSWCRGRALRMRLVLV